MRERMDDDTDTHPVHFLWIHWSEHIVSFHEVAGYERKEFSSSEEKMDYVFQKTSNGFRIQ